MNKIGIVLVRYRYGPYEPYDSGEAVTYVASFLLEHRNWCTVFYAKRPYIEGSHRSGAAFEDRY